jgi:hypothetical protein
MRLSVPLEDSYQDQGYLFYLQCEAGLFPLPFPSLSLAFDVQDSSIGELSVANQGCIEKFPDDSWQ